MLNYPLRIVTLLHLLRCAQGNGATGSEVEIASTEITEIHLENELAKDETRRLQASTTWDQVGIDINGVVDDTRFGYAVSMSGDGSRLAVGAILQDVPRYGTNAGLARMYEYSEGEGRYVLLGSSIVGRSEDGLFGRVISMSTDGNRVAIGSYLNYIEIYEYDETQTNWKRLGTISGDISGEYLCLSGDGSRVLTVSDDKLRAQVYEWNGNAWKMLGLTFGITSGQVDKLNSVSMSREGNHVALGSIDAGTNGIAKVYNWDGETWTQFGSDLTTSSPSILFGSSIALNTAGTRVAVSAPFDENENHNGVIVVFEYRNGWQQLGDVMEGTSDEEKFGANLDLAGDGDLLATYVPGCRRQETGCVRVYGYSEDSQTWSQQGRDIAGDNSYDKFGFDVSLAADGSRLAIGAPQAGGDGLFRRFDQYGKVRVYQPSQQSAIAFTGIKMFRRFCPAFICGRGV